MIGTTLATADTSTAHSGFTELPDVASHIITLALQNQDNFGSQYGYRGTDYDYKLLIRNTVESPRPGSPKITRHNAEFQMTKRATITSGIVTPSVPYVVGLTMRFPETGTQAFMVGLAAALTETLMGTSGAKLLKMINFES